MHHFFHNSIWAASGTVANQRLNKLTENWQDEFKCTYGTLISKVVKTTTQDKHNGKETLCRVLLHVLTLWGAQFFQAKAFSLLHFIQDETVQQFSHFQSLYDDRARLDEARKLTTRTLPIIPSTAAEEILRRATHFLLANKNSKQEIFHFENFTEKEKLLGGGNTQISCRASR